jgi:hypothetical protein
VQPRRDVLVEVFDWDGDGGSALVNEQELGADLTAHLREGATGCDTFKGTVRDQSIMAHFDWLGLETELVDGVAYLWTTL